MENMDTALYYTFSTIAQTLAGAIALLSAFVLYQLQSLHKEMEEKSGTVICQYNDEHRKILQDYENHGQYDELFEYVLKHPLDSNQITDHIKSSQERLGVLVQSKKSLMADFRFSLFLTVGLIAASIIVLSVTPILNTLCSVVFLTFIIGIVWFITCLAKYVCLVNKILT